MVCDKIDSIVYVSTPVGDFMAVNHVYRTCFILFMGLYTFEDFILLDMVE